MKFAALLPWFAFAGIVSAADGPADPATADDKSSGFLTGSLLPNGSILENVTLPNYDEHLNLTTSLHSKRLIIHDKATNVEGISMVVDFFSVEKKRTGSLQLQSATYNQTAGILRSDKPFVLVSDQLDATGSALVYDVTDQRGFLSGPITADAILQKATAMNTHPILNPLALGAAMVAASAFATAAPPKPLTAQEEKNLDARSNVSGQALIDKARLTPAERQEISDQSKTARPLAEDAKIPGTASLQQASADHLMVHDALAEFAAKVAMTTLVTTVKDPGTEASGDVPPPPPLDGQKTHITADEGAYIDREKGILVFMKNVVVHDEASLGDLTGADELKVLFKPMPPKPDPKTKDAKDGKDKDPKAADAGGKSDKPKPTDEEMKAAKAEALAKAASEKGSKTDKKGASGDLGGNGMGELQRIIATGKAVVVTKKAATAEESDMQASGHIVIYEPDKHELIIKGGSPWVITKGKMIHLKGEDGYIRYNTETEEANADVGKNGTMALDLVSDRPAKSDKDKKADKDKDKKNDKTTPPVRAGH